MLADALHGATVEESWALATDYRGLMMGDAISDERRKALGELPLMESVRQFPVRIKCALLALTAVEEALSGVR